VLVACGARTELRTGAPATDSGTTTDATTLACPSIAQIAQTSSRPDALVIDGDYVYWHDAKGISRVHKSGGAPEWIVANQLTHYWPHLAPFALGGGYVFYADTLDYVSRVPVSGGAPEKFGFGAVETGFASGTSHVYFWERTVGVTDIKRIDFAGQGLVTWDTVPEPPSEMVFDGDAQAIAAADPGVFDVHSGGPEILSGLSAVDLAFDPTHVYFTSDDATNGSRVMTLVISSLATTPIADTAGAYAIAIDANDIYFTDRTALRVRRIANKTGPVTDVASSDAGFEPIDVALDGACVFWTSAAHADDAPGAVMVAPKP
jgi:hypothetical protein